MTMKVDMFIPKIVEKLKFDLDNNYWPHMFNVIANTSPISWNGYRNAGKPSYRQYYCQYVNTWRAHIQYYCQYHLVLTILLNVCGRLFPKTS